MADRKNLDRLAEKLLDTGKRNKLINFKDTKASSAEVIYPDCETVFSKCAEGKVFEIYDPKIPDEDLDDIDTEQSEGSEEDNKEKRLSRSEYRDHYLPRIRSDKYLLVYSQTPNPLTAVKNIAKKAKEIQDESGIDVAYLAFGFIRWNEKEGSNVFYRAPLLLMHVNIITGSVIDPIKIEISDDDVVVNPTFAIVLKNQRNLSLPEFKDEDTLTSYFAKVESSLKKLGWRIENECKLGIFSFQKINMYEDLKNNADRILANENVRVLLGDPISPGSDTDTYRKVDNPLIDLHTVVDADSSQIEAIEMAKSGKSFVLQGPPGTGKSQTITNIIAECLHDRKKVLFVSEKQAALNVVYDKLKKAGLEDFCLELHSHKANKRAVIGELNRTLETPQSSVSPSTEEEIRQKQEAQKQLDTYAVALHQRRATINKSLYQLFELYSSVKHYPALKLDIRNVLQKGQDHLQTAVRLLEQYAEYTASVGLDCRQYAWYGFKNRMINYEGRNQLKSDLETLIFGYRQLCSMAVEIRTKYGTQELSFSDLRRWQSMLAFFSDSDVITPSLLSQDTFSSIYSPLKDMKEQSEIIRHAKDQISSDFNPDVIDEYEGKELLSQLTGQYRSWLRRLFNRDYKILIAGLQSYFQGKNRLKYKTAVDLAENLVKFQNAMAIFKRKEPVIREHLGSCYCGPDTDWDHVITAIRTLQVLYGENDPKFGTIARMSADEFNEHKRDFKSDAFRLNQQITAIDNARQRVAQQFNPKVLDLNTNSYNHWIHKIESCLAEFNNIGNWLGFIDLSKQITDADLTSFVNLLIREKVDPEQMTGAYKRNFYRHWIGNILFLPEFRTFKRISHDQAVRKFAEKDSLQYKISRLQIKAELSQDRPSLDLETPESAVYVLRKEAKKKRKQMPIRKLFAVTGGLVQKIKPCFLMSPLSVSTFLEPNAIKFDTIVFDEASQIFLQDAIGAIYRGKQLIVVGDSKQMPPSNFFNSSTNNDEDDDEDYDDVSGFESILDICSAAFTEKQLAWHYRSHYEQLITFSNLHFYNNNLITFPSPTTDHEGIGIDYYHVNGVFDRKSKTNRVEAEFIVDLIYRHIKEYPNRSLGVVAFSIAQQNMIDKLLSKKREADPSCEEFFRPDREEPFFIKNLETVQGDERDTIIFSIAYAKDSQGRFIQNFGPLNRQGGERRLNVAVTRAKDNVQLVASIHHTDLSNTATEGVRLLRAYLDYAENGEAALERAITVPEQDQFDSYFEQEVCDFLRDNGYTVDTQVGCSGYRIDLGLRKPDSSNYLLAIECDGATYHRSKNARDRDVLRQRVLENMGWTFYRIWSTDWFQNPVVEKELLLKAAKDAVSRADTPKGDIENNAQRIAEQETPEPQFSREIRESGFSFPEYKQADAVQVVLKHPTSLQNAIREILETEAPLSEEYLLKRIVSILFESERVTKSVKDEFNKKMFRCESKGIIRRHGFLYLQSQDVNDIKLRIPGDQRDIGFISIEELANGFYALIEQNVSASEEGLYKKMNDLLGFSRTGVKIKKRYNEALRSLVNSGRVIVEKDMLKIR